MKEDERAPGASRSMGGRTWVGRGYRLRVVVPEGVSDRRHDSEGDWAEGTDHAGPEEGGALARRPAPVPDGLLPEEGRSAGHFGCFEWVVRRYRA